MQHPMQVIHPRRCLLLVNGPIGDRASLIVVPHRSVPEHEHAIPSIVQEFSKKRKLAACHHAL